ncbi:hypothetical protein P7K49_002975 [Saguinus oedipus]|uniref:Uncharacterized protein n=1 Tax=Saguinus oedipus TaxID=9490 RepID=A0ABQ9WIV9_SAGOE|nr:hypothetical protein P7K49_002975 [Saguinus oedipus]
MQVTARDEAPSYRGGAAPGSPAWREGGPPGVLGWRWNRGPERRLQEDPGVPERVLIPEGLGGAASG